MLTDGGDPAGPEENATTSDHHGTPAGELDDEERMLRVTDLEYVREAEVEHLALGRCATSDDEGPGRSAVAATAALAGEPIEGRATRV